MEIGELVAKQIAADTARGFRVDYSSEKERQRQIEKDLVGLLGEIGEFANLTKKVGLGLEHKDYSGPNFDQAIPPLREELADATIYIIRLFSLLGADMESEILRKMAINNERYSRLGS